MRRKRSPRVVWLPGTNANSIDAAGQSSWNIFQLDLPVGAALGDEVVGEVPIVIDGDQDPTLQTSSLADIENQGYRLRRIVGKIYVLCFGTAQGAAEQVGVTAGFIIRRINPQTGVSLALTTGNAQNVSPAQIVSQGDPWIWRRSWMLFNQQDPLFAGFPSSNWSNQAGGTFDGPHIDQKTARIVSNEERLFLSISMTALGLDVEPTTGTTSLSIVYETRVLASMRSSSGNRRNASR